MIFSMPDVACEIFYRFRSNRKKKQIIFKLPQFHLTREWYLLKHPHNKFTINSTLPKDSRVGRKKKIIIINYKVVVRKYRLISLEYQKHFIDIYIYLTISL